MRIVMLGGLMAATFLSPAALQAAIVPTADIQVTSDARAALPGLADAANQQRDRRGDRARGDGARGDRQRGDRGNRNRANRGQGQSIRAQQDAALAHAQRMAHQSRADTRNDRRDYRNDRRNDRNDRRDYRNDRRDYRRDQRNDRRIYRDQRRNIRQDYRRGQQIDNRFRYNGRSFNRWNNGWRNDRRYNWRNYRANNRGLFSSRYYSPYRNYRYSRLSIGATLGSLFYGNRYRINDPYRYRLPAVYGPYRWVRYFGDAVLVDVRNGRTVDVVYDFFY
ncbi:RcnB family protein [Novosphingopyxis baekryungensis]|uniref:RcnB family protein n=1 Tax=Novosphingopyxis baekryungensis TaxID=279369 RepID=UPI0003B5B6EE|nr:RcnB family protein [Novosphingopyxis baekryungensis]